MLADGRWPEMKLAGPNVFDSPPYSFILVLGTTKTRDDDGAVSEGLVQDCSDTCSLTPPEYAGCGRLLRSPQ